MSVIGYSLNDSIVVSDRIRENFRKIRRGTPYEIFNVSLTQTLHRTLITSGTTLMVILMLYLFGGPVLEGFSLTMLIGVSIGTASSIYVASALALNYDHWHYSVVARYWHDGGQWNDDAELNFGNGNFNVRSTGWGGYLVVGYNF